MLQVPYIRNTSVIYYMKRIQLLKCLYHIVFNWDMMRGVIAAILDPVVAANVCVKTI